MMDYREMAQEITLIIKNLYQRNHEFADVFSTVNAAIKKYDTTFDEVTLGIAKVDYQKLIWQILIDLRFARGTDYDFDIELYRCDTIALQDITSFLENNTTEFNREGSSVADISAIDRAKYLELIAKYELI